MIKMHIDDYLMQFGNLTFNEFPINEIDICVGATLSYADYLASSICDKFDLLNDEIPLAAFKNKKTIEVISMRYLSGAKIYENFFNLVLNSKRFKDLRITNVINYFNASVPVQFYAMTYKVDNKVIIIYRGTDNTIAGWKEDLLTAIKDQVPAQKLAVKYLDYILEKEKGDVYIVGHSKGGNLAYYAFFNTSDENKKRIIRTYNLDGSGFKNDKYDYLKYRKQIKKIVPSEDIVGVIMDNCSKKTFVKSDSFSIFCHDMLTWRIDSKKLTKFYRQPGLTLVSKAFQKAINNWLDEMSEEDIEDFIEFIFMIADIDSPKTIKDLLNSIFSNSFKYFRSAEKYPKEKRKRLQSLSFQFNKDLLKYYLEEGFSTIKIEKKTNIKKEK